MRVVADTGAHQLGHARAGRRRYSAPVAITNGARVGSEAIPRRRASLTFVGRAKVEPSGSTMPVAARERFRDLLQEGRPVRRVGVDPPVGIDVFDGASPTRTGDLLRHALFCVLGWEAGG
jgi:hypothetical protein